MGKAAQPVTDRLDHRRGIENHFVAVLLAILAGAALIYTLRNPQYRTGSFNDDAIYVIGARDFWRPAALRSHLLKPDYPSPGLPLLLSPFALLITSNWILLESLTVVFTVLLVYIAALWARRFLSAGQTLAATALLAFNPFRGPALGIGDGGHLLHVGHRGELLPYGCVDGAADA